MVEEVVVEEEEVVEEVVEEEVAMEVLVRRWRRRWRWRCRRRRWWQRHLALLEARAHHDHPLPLEFVLAHHQTQGREGRRLVLDQPAVVPVKWWRWWRRWRWW